ncbi:MAG: hypothetical protein DWQ37_21000 [Planctomycetota bacterium]|nr:MAG: hypothetical protein DWQ37_21000 [Planctomycetota bacterium]
MNTLVLKLKQELDEQGNLEEFTNDVNEITDSDTLEHLDADGLPATGTHVSEGMLLVAKIGATKAYSKARLPNVLERATLAEQEVVRRIRALIYDRSLYVPQGVAGVVKSAYFEQEGDRRVAVVHLELD